MVRRNRALCVKVAKDVIAQLNAERYRATTGKYVEVDTSELPKDLIFADGYLDGSFKDLFKKQKEVTCEVCALGSAFVSLVNVQNACSVEEMTDDIQRENFMFERLAEVFGPKNMALMESAFENVMSYSETWDDENLQNVWLRQAMEWGQQYADSEDRLRAIMRNVIRNGGDFVLPKEYTRNIDRYLKVQKELEEARDE